MQNISFTRCRVATIPRLAARKKRKGEPLSLWCTTEILVFSSNLRFAFLRIKDNTFYCFETSSAEDTKPVTGTSYRWNVTFINYSFSNARFCTRCSHAGRETRFALKHRSSTKTRRNRVFSHECSMLGLQSNRMAKSDENRKFLQAKVKISSSKFTTVGNVKFHKIHYNYLKRFLRQFARVKR